MRVIPGVAREARLPLATLCHAFSVKTRSPTVDVGTRSLPLAVL